MEYPTGNGSNWLDNYDQEKVEPAQIEKRKMKNKE